MKEHVVVDPMNGDVPEPVNYVTGRARFYMKNGHAFYWSSFFILIFIEFFLGGQLSRILTKENYFTYVNVINNIPFYNVLVNIGLSYGLVYIIAQHPGIRFVLFRQAIYLQNVWYAAVVLIHLVVFFVFSDLWPRSLLITAIISFAYVSRLNLTSFFLATRSYNKAAIANLLQKTALLVVFLFICNSSWITDLFNKRFLVLYPIAEVSVVILYIIAFRRTIDTSLHSAKINYRKRILKYSKYALFNNTLNVLYYSIMVFIIRSSAIDLHLKIIFGLCIMFFRYTGVTIAPVFSIMNPVITAIKSDPVKVRDMYKKYFVVILAMSLLVLTGCRFLFGFIITHFYADSYHDLPQYFYFFCYMIPLLFINSLNSSVLAALGKIKYTFRVELVCTVVLLLFFVYNLLAPIAQYSFFYYIVLAHLCVKFLMLGYGTYMEVQK